MNNVALRYGLARWATKHFPQQAWNPWTEEDVADVLIDYDPGYAYSSVTYEDASFNIVLVLTDGRRIERGWSEFEDEGFKLGHFVAEVVELSRSFAS